MPATKIFVNFHRTFDGCGRILLESGSSITSVTLDLAETAIGVAVFIAAVASLPLLDVRIKACLHWECDQSLCSKECAKPVCARICFPPAK